MKALAQILHHSSLCALSLTLMIGTTVTSTSSAQEEVIIVEPLQPGPAGPATPRPIQPSPANPAPRPIQPLPSNPNPQQVIPREPMVEAPSRPVLETPPAQTFPAQPSVNVTLNFDDTARLLAGMPISAARSASRLESYEPWLSHKTLMDEAFLESEDFRLRRMRQWASTEIHPNLRAAPEVVYYFFGGPDFLTVTNFLPAAKTYILAGLEPIGNNPNVSQVPPDQLSQELNHLRFSLRSLLKKGFFETKEMRLDLKGNHLDSTLAILQVFLVRTGHHIRDVRHIALDAKGTLSTADPNKASGVAITFNLGSNPTEQTLYYFKTDLSDSGVSKNPAFLNFCARFNQGQTGGAYLKAASYLMHQNSFSKVRTFLLEKSSFVLQDESGIPVRTFLANRDWDLAFYGNYVGPVELFKEYYQPEMAEFYRRPDLIRPLPFGTGYRNQDSDSNQLFARKRF